jgi:hypothetical protein
MNDAGHTVSLDPDEIGLVYDALRFARDEFTDESGLSWSDEEYARLQDVIDRLERRLPVSNAG